MSEESITKKAARTSIWGTIERLFTYGVQFLVTILLARLLSPSDYGIIAMINVFIAISQQFVECGISNALIRKKDCNEVDYSTAFYFNILIGVVTYVLLFIAAPLIASFYEQNIICPVIRIYGLNLILQSFSLVQNAILTKELKAERIAIIAIMASLISGLASIVCAFRGLGVWSLVVQTLMYSIVNLICLWLLTSWRPSLTWSNESMKYLWGFGSKMLATGIIGSIYRNIYSIVIGKVYSMKATGIFNRGQTLSELIPNIVQGVFVRNTLPIMAQIQDDRERLVHVYREFCVLVSLITFPAVLLLCALAKPFVMVVLTEKWVESIIYVQVFCMTTITYPVNAVNLNLIQVYGRSDITLKAEIIKKSLGLLIVAVMLRFGPFYLAIGGSFMNLIAYIVNLYYAKKLAGVSFCDQISDLIRPFAAAAISAVIAFLPQVCKIPYSLQLVIGVMLGLAFYYLLSKYVFKIKMIDRLLIFMRKK